MSAGVTPGAGLQGRGVVVTRPKAQAAALIAQLEAAGARPFAFPVIEIAPVENLQPVASAIAELERFALAFFVSANAVDAFFTVLGSRAWPEGLRAAATGPATAEALKNRGVAAPLVPPDQFDSEGVLALPAFAREAMAGRRVLVLRGNGGRELLAERLREYGAQVDVVACYQRLPGSSDPLPLLTAFEAGRIDALTFTSSEGARNFKQMLGADAAGMLAKLPCFAPHPRITEALAVLGAQHPVLTPAADAGLLAALHKHFG